MLVVGSRIYDWEYWDRKMGPSSSADDSDEASPSSLSPFFLASPAARQALFARWRHREPAKVVVLLSFPPPFFFSCPHPQMCPIIWDWLFQVVKVWTGWRRQRLRPNGKHMCRNNELTRRCRKMKPETFKYTLLPNARTGRKTFC